jgi:hypothetical protein
MVTEYIEFNKLFKSNKLISRQDSITVDRTNTAIFKELKFKDCTFQKNRIKDESDKTNIVNTEIIQLNNRTHKSKIVFSDCRFSGKTIFSGQLDYTFIFNNCYFENVLFNEVNVNSHPSYQDFKSSYFFNNIIKVDSIEIKNCEFGGKFYINNQKENDQRVDISHITIQETKFNDNFKLHNCKVETILLDGIDFKEKADFFKSEFGTKTENKTDKEIVFKSINFKELAIFEECVFYEKFIIEYATFENLAQFRNATFKYGLDLDRTNILKALNFYGIKELDKKHSKDNTSQETYKIIKYYSRKSGSLIEANKYHALELEKKRQNLSILNLGDWLVFNANYTTSLFGTSWFTALRWIIYVGVITSIWINWSHLEVLLETKKFIMSIIKYMSIIHFDELKKHPEIFLFNKVALGYLYYQFVTAIRKDTRK